MWTNAYGATSSSTTIAARRFRRRFRPLTESPQVVNTNSSPSSTNHTGITCGCPVGPLVASLAVRVPWLRKAWISSGFIVWGIAGRSPARARLRDRSVSVARAQARRRSSWLWSCGLLGLDVVDQADDVVRHKAADRAA